MSFRQKNATQKRKLSKKNGVAYAPCDFDSLADSDSVSININFCCGVYITDCLSLYLAIGSRNQTFLLPFGKPWRLLLRTASKGNVLPSLHNVHLQRCWFHCNIQCSFSIFNSLHYIIVYVRLLKFFICCCHSSFRNLGWCSLIDLLIILSFSYFAVLLCSVVVVLQMDPFTPTVTLFHPSLP